MIWFGQEKQKGTPLEGLTKQEAYQWKWIEEGKPVISTGKLRTDIPFRQGLIQKAIDIKGYDYVKSFIQRGEQVFKYEQLLDSKAWGRFTFNLKKVVGKTYMDFSKVDRLKPLGPTAPYTMSEFFGQRPDIVVGGSTIITNIYKQEFGLAPQVYTPKLRELFKMPKDYKPYEMKPHDVDWYKAGDMIKPSAKLYGLLGGKKIPKTY